MRTEVRAISAALIVVGCLACRGVALAAEEREMTEAEKKACQQKLHIDPKGNQALRSVPAPQAHACRTGLKNGLPVPDPNCTPGAINPTASLAVLTDPEFKTGCERDQGSSAELKKKTYAFYDLEEPRENSGPNQTCELDHFISLELGGSDMLDNIWPQCGPDGVALDQRFFKLKDTVEDFLAWLVKYKKIDLALAQRCIAGDWTQFLAQAQKYCPGGECPKNDGPTFEVTSCNES